MTVDLIKIIGDFKLFLMQSFNSLMQVFKIFKFMEPSLFDGVGTETKTSQFVRLLLGYLKI